MNKPYVQPSRFSEAAHAVALKIGVYNLEIQEPEKGVMDRHTIPMIAIHDLMKRVDSLEKEVQALKNTPKYDHGGGPL